MLRVNNQNPCPVCHKPDYCLYAKDGTAAICARIVENSVKQCGGAGYLHILKPGDFKPKPVVKKRPATINWGCLNDCYIQAVSKLNRDSLGTVYSRNFDLCVKWQVDSRILQMMQTGWDGEAYTFPVRNANDEIIGITRRWPDGTKGMVKGSQVGIHIPRVNWDNLETLFICEGASDTATALDMGLRAIGRVSCQTGRDHIIKFCVQKRPTQIVIVADNDSAGITGAKILGVDISHGYKLFTATRPIIKIITPPTSINDLRKWRQNGLTLGELIQIVDKDLDFES